MLAQGCRCQGSAPPYVPARIPEKAVANLVGSWRGVPSPTARSATSSARTQPRGRRAQGPLVPDRARVDQHVVDPQAGRVLGQHVEVVLGGEAVGLALLGREVEHHQPAARGVLQRRPQLGHEQVRDHAGEPRARARSPPSRPRRSLQGLRAGGRLRGVELHRADLAAVEATSTWPRTRPRVGVAGSAPRTSAVMSSGIAAIGSTRPRAPSSRPTSRARRRGRRAAPTAPRSAGCRPRARPCSPVGGEAVLEDVGPGAAPVVVAAQRGQRHAQVTGREAAELLAQPARGAAVVGDRDDGGERR